MTTKNDGGPAFPQPIHKHQFDTTPRDFTDNGCEGMSLRDWFAGMALQGMLSGNPEIPEIARNVPERAAAITAYNFADEMLKARAQ